MLEFADNDHTSRGEPERVIAPEYIYYFESASARSRRHGGAELNEQVPPHITTPTRLKRALFAGLVKFSVFFTALSTPYAAQFETTAPGAKSGSISGQGLDALKAQMNALNSGLENLRRLRGFLNNAGLANESVLARAQQLIETLPQHEKAADAAWRIAAVASLTLQSGALADVDVNDDYRLARGAVGWDLGPEGSQVHAGFTPITPRTLTKKTPTVAITGATALSDGIKALNSFEASLPNGLYRVFIVRDSSQGKSLIKNPFGGDISVNGAPIKSQLDGNRERLKLTGAEDRSSAQPPRRAVALGLAVEGWAIVEKGRLRVEFEDLPDGTAITAIIAEPFEIDKIDLAPEVAEALASALGDIAPAAGPDRQLSRQGRRSGGSGSQSGSRQGAKPQSISAQKGTVGGVAPNRAVSGLSRSGFAASRGRSTPSFSPSVPASADEVAVLLSSLATAQEDTPFERRDILVKRSAGRDPDTEGMAIDLGILLDSASPSGVFSCLIQPCSDIPPLAEEPDLVAAIDALGDWLADPENLPEGWGDLEAVLASRVEGSEIAIVYEFDVDTAFWTDVELRASAGSGIFVWLDGSYIFGAAQDDGFSDDLEFEYRLELPDLVGGQHFLQILSESHLPDLGLALELRGTQVPNASVAAVSVTEPGTLALYGLGLLGIGLVLRQRRHIPLHPTTSS